MLPIPGTQVLLKYFNLAKDSLTTRFNYKYN